MNNSKVIDFQKKREEKEKRLLLERFNYSFGEFYDVKYGSLTITTNNKNLDSSVKEWNIKSTDSFTEFWEFKDE